jgi:hypothetical protein
VTRLRRPAAWTVAVCATGALAVAAPPTAAQDTPPLTTSFESLPEHIRVGSLVVVITPQGRAAAGRVVEITSSSITVDEGGPVTFRVQYVESIFGERGRPPVWKSAKIGFWSGVVLAALAALGSAIEEDCAPDECMTGRDVAIAFAALPATGAGIGAGVGLLLPGRRTLIYRAGPPASISLAPVAGRGQRGLAVRIAF